MVQHEEARNGTGNISPLYPVASRAAVRDSILHSPKLLLSHFLNAQIMPSGKLSTVFPFSRPPLEHMTTELVGTKGRSSAEAARMPYSCANTNAARKAADLVDLC